MSKQKKIFLIIAVVFTTVMIALAYDMASRTTSPWNKKKFEEKYRVK